MQKPIYQKAGVAVKKTHLCLIIILLCGMFSSVLAGQIEPNYHQFLLNSPLDMKQSVLVILNNNNDIRALDQQLHEDKTPLPERHLRVIEALKANARANQGPILRQLEQWKAERKVEGYTAHWVENIIVVSGTNEIVQELLNNPAVKAIEPNFTTELIAPVSSRGPVRFVRPSSLDNEQTTPGQDAIGATRVNRELGITGQGVLVANCDTGVDWEHPALVTHFRGRPGGAPMAECWLDLLGGSPNAPSDNNGHGSHVMGTICGREIRGNGDTITVGSAPNAEFICTNPINQGVGGGFDNDIIDAFEWFIDPDGDASTMEDVPDVIQNSWGVNTNLGYVQCFNFWNTVILNCEAAGPVITWSAGNEGSAGLRSPAIYQINPLQIFSVGAVDATNHSAPYPIADFSSRGPTPCEPNPGAIKPEISAPGVDVLSVQANSNGYVQQDWSGTSMAGPHVAGVVALMREACPSCDPQTIKEAIMLTAIDAGYGPVGEDNTFGAGFINAYDAVLMVSSLGRIDGIVTDAGGNPLQGVRVQAIGENPFATTNVNGYYLLMASEGTYSVRYSKFGYNTVVEEDVESVLDDTTHVNVTMSTVPSGNLSGLVQLQTGTPMANAQVLILNTPIDTITTNAQGRFRITLPATQYQIRVWVAFAPVDTVRTYTLDTTLTIQTGDTTFATLSIVIPQFEPQGPDVYGYTAYDRQDRDYPTSYDWVELSPYPPDNGQGTPFAFAHQDSAVFLKAPFPIRFYGQTYDTLTINCNGWMLPGVHHGSGRINTRIPFVDQNEPHGVIAPYWDDFRNGLSAERWQWYDEINGRWILEFTTEQLVSPSTYTFFWQVQIFDPAIAPTRTGDGDIVFLYQRIPFDSWCTVGIEKPDETTGLQLIYNDTLNTKAFPIRDSSAVRFTTGVPTTFGTVAGTLTTYPAAGNITSGHITIGGHTTNLNANGQYSVASVPSGTLTAVLTLNNYESRRVGQVLVNPNGSTTLNFDAWRLDAPTGLSAWQRDGIIHLSWQRPQSIALYPADWMRYSLIRNGNIVTNALTDTMTTDTLAADQSAVYRIIANYRNGVSQPSDSVRIAVDLSGKEINSLLPREFAMEQNYPNPFNPNTNIRLAIPAASEGNLRIYDVNGRLVQTLVEGQFAAGYHVYQWEAENFATGVYFYRFTSDKFTCTKKMLLIK